MELKWLEDFIALAATSSFSRAADTRHVTQSAFSRRIKQLELWLGVTLVNRATFPAELTREGRTFLPVAQETVRQFYNTRKALQPSREVQNPVLTFSALHTLTVTFFPYWLKQIENDIGGIRSLLSPDRGGFEDNIATLTEGEVHFFLTYAHSSVPILIDRTQFPYIVLGTERLLPVSRPSPAGPTLDHALASGEPLPYLSYGDFSFFGAVLSQKFASGNAFERQVVHENTMSIGLKAMAVADWGTAWLPESLISDELRRGELVPASADPYWDVTVEIRIYRHDAALPAHAESFWEYLQAKDRAISEKGD